MREQLLTTRKGSMLSAKALYAAMPCWAQHSAVSTYGLYWYWLRFGRGYQESRDSYARREAFTRVQWEGWRSKELKELLSIAAEQVPYYRKTWSPEQRRAANSGALRELPLLPKEPIRRAPKDFLRADKRLRHPFIFHTSGSTGTPIATYWSAYEMRKSMAIREARSTGWAGVSFRLPRATFSGRMVEPLATSEGPFYRFNAVEKQVYLSAFHIRPDTVPAYVHALQKHQVQWCTGYAVSFYLLARFLLEAKLPPLRLKAVITTSEKLTPEMREVMSEAYGCRIYEEYGTVENSLFASECEAGRLHVSEDIGIVEILRADGSACLPGEIGEVVATSLLRHHQIFVRYRLGDLACWDPEDCPCGRKMPVIKDVVGRLEDIVIGARRATAGALSQCLYRATEREGRASYSGSTRPATSASGDNGELFGAGRARADYQDCPPGGAGHADRSGSGERDPALEGRQIQSSCFAADRGPAGQRTPPRAGRDERALHGFVASGSHPVRRSSVGKRMSDNLPFRRWLLLTQYYHPEPGAPQVRLRALAKELTRRGCEVEILTAMPNYPTGRIFDGYRGKLTHTEIIDRCTVRRLWLYAGAGRSSFARLLCYLSFSIAALFRIPFLKKPDVVFVEAQPVTMAFAGWLSKLLRGVPFIYNTPDLQVEIAQDERWIGSRVLLDTAKRIENFLMRRSFCVATVTDAFVTHFSEERGIPRSHISFFPNGADTEELMPAVRDDLYAEQLGVTGKKIFAYCGTQAHYHGLEVLVETAALLRPREDIVILMVGKGPLRGELQQQASSLGLTNLRFVDSPFSEMRRLMSITTASLATVARMKAAAKMRLSKVVPPLACGVPVIYVGEGEFTKILEERCCGLVVQPSSAEKLAAAIVKLADDPAVAASMGKRGREYVATELSWSSIVERWLDDLSCIKSGKDLWQHRQDAIVQYTSAAPTSSELSIEQAS